MGEARKHHYVPVFYQNHFTNDNGLLFVYDRKRQIYLELHPRSICHQSDLYATKPTDGRPRDRRMEGERHRILRRHGPLCRARYANEERESLTASGEALSLAGHN